MMSKRRPGGLIVIGQAPFGKINIPKNVTDSWRWRGSWPRQCLGDGNSGPLTTPVRAA